MKLDRRRLLATGGACLASAATRPALPKAGEDTRLDQLFAAHANELPERAGAGANHYPMAAEVLDALGHEEAIDEAWIDGARLYAGELVRGQALGTDESLRAALGHYERYADWLTYFRTALKERPWRSVVGEWAPRLAPGICAAAFHGVIRTGHAARALRVRETDPRRNELAVGLAYWAARYLELPSRTGAPLKGNLLKSLEGIEYPWVEDHTDVDFFSVGDRLTENPIAPSVELEGHASSPRADLHQLVRDAATGVLEMLVLERNRIWLMHTVTGPAAVEWLLPEVDPAGARKLVEYARQAVLAMYIAYGEPFTPGAHLRPSPPPWPELIEQAVDSRSVHSIKLVDALYRFDVPDDLLCRSAFAQWLEWR